MDYKKEIYNLWAQKNVDSLPMPNENFIKQRQEGFKRAIIDKFFGVNKELKILDLGCGWGTILSACKKFGYENLTGVDVNEKFIEFARKKFNIKNLICADIAEFLDKDLGSSYDVIMAFDVMEHLKKAEILHIAELIFKKLNKNGIFIMQVPNAGSLSGLYIFNSDLTHEIPFTDILVKELPTIAGFEDIKIIKHKNNYFIKLIRMIFSKLIAFENEFMFSTNLVVISKKNE